MFRKKGVLKNFAYIYIILVIIFVIYLPSQNS